MYTVIDYTTGETSATTHYDWAMNMLKASRERHPDHHIELVDSDKEARISFRNYLLESIELSDGEYKTALEDVLDCYDHADISIGLDTFKND